MTIDEMLQKDGVYVMIGRREYFFVEVEAGKCYQLKSEPPYPRDGELNREGWNPHKVLEIHGPFGRL